MNRNLAFLAVVLLAFLCQTGLSQDVRLGTTVQPERQQIYLSVDPAGDNFTGNTEIRLKVNESTQSFRLHALDITITKATLEGQDLKVESAENDTVRLRSDKVLEPGTYSLRLEFTGPYNRNSVGLYKYMDGDLPYLSTQFEMTDARRAFPCFDEPGFKIPYQMTIEAPADQRVFSNAAEISTEEKGDRVVHHFGETPPIPSYLVACAIGPFESVDVPGMNIPIRLVASKGKLGLTRYAQKVTPPILAALESYFDLEYPYGKLDQIAIAEFPFGAMENAGCVTYKDTALLLNPDSIQNSDKITTSTIIAHELAHQWFGNQVTMKWWDDLWLNEAFATWLAEKIVFQEYPDLESHLRVGQNDVMGDDAGLASKPIRKPIRTEADILDGILLAYRKGGATLSMVERWMGEKTFREGMRLYMKRHRFGNAEASDLWNALGEVSGKDVESVLVSFTEQPGYPLITLTPSGAKLTVRQERYTPFGVKAPDLLWSVPLVIRYGAGEKVATVSLLLDEKTSELDLEFAPEWLMADDGGFGYFRWSVPPDYLARLVKRKDVLSDKEKLATLHNINALFQAGEIDAGQSLDDIASFLDDEQPAVVTLVLEFLEGYHDTFVGKHNEELWTKYLAARLQPTVDRYGMKARPHEPPRVPELRNTLLKTLAMQARDPGVLVKAGAQGRLYLEGSDEVDPVLGARYLNLYAVYADAEVVDLVATELAKATDPQRRQNMLLALGLFGKEESQKKAMDYMLKDVITPSDLRTLLSLNAAYSESRRQRLQNWLEINFVELRAKIPGPFLANIPLSLAGAREQEQLDAILAFYSKQPDSNGAIGRALEKVEESTVRKIATVERGQEAFDDYLRNQANP